MSFPTRYTDVNFSNFGELKIDTLYNKCYSIGIKFNGNCYLQTSFINFNEHHKITNVRKWKVNLSAADQLYHFYNRLDKYIEDELSKYYQDKPINIQYNKIINNDNTVFHYLMPFTDIYVSTEERRTKIQFITRNNGIYPELVSHIEKAINMRFIIILVLHIKKEKNIHYFDVELRIKAIDICNKEYVKFDYNYEYILNRMLKIKYDIIHIRYRPENIRFLIEDGEITTSSFFK